MKRKWDGEIHNVNYVLQNANGSNKHHFFFIIVSKMWDLLADKWELLALIW